jgi:lactonase
MHINDMVFDIHGNIFFTDFRGFAFNPVGGVYRLDAADGYKKVNQLVGNLASPNGISMSPQGNVLWVAEPGRNAIIKLSLTPDGDLAPMNGFAYIYRNTGDDAPDSNKVDSAGNLYQPMMMGGRVLILNKHGVPIANVLIPGREKGLTLMSPNLAIKPGTKEAYVQAAGPGGTWLYRFEALAEAQVLYSHR